MGPGWGDEMAKAASFVLTVVAVVVLGVGFAAGWLARGCQHYPRIVWQAKGGPR